MVKSIPPSRTLEITTYCIPGAHLPPFFFPPLPETLWAHHVPRRGVPSHTRFPVPSRTHGTLYLSWFGLCIQVALLHQHHQKHSGRLGVLAPYSHQGGIVVVVVVVVAAHLHLRRRIIVGRSYSRAGYHSGQSSARFWPSAESPSCCPWESRRA